MCQKMLWRLNLHVDLLLIREEGNVLIKVFNTLIMMIKMPKKGESFSFKNYDRKIKSPFMIYTDFQISLVPEDNGKQNPDQSYMTNVKNMLLAVIAIN